MRTLNTTLEQAITDADGRYLDNQALLSLEHYLQSYKNRLEVYQLLRENGEQIVMKALHKLAHDYPDMVQKHGPRCKYDMTQVMRYLALSVLRDDETFFRDQVIDWLFTVLHAYKRHEQCATAYHHLLDEMAESLPPRSFDIVRPYLENVVIQTLQTYN